MFRVKSLKMHYANQLFQNLNDDYASTNFSIFLKKNLKK